MVLSDELRSRLDHWSVNVQNDSIEDTLRPPRTQLWSLREDVLVEAEPGDGDVILHSRWGEVTLPRPGATLREALRRMSFGPISLENAIGESGERARLDRLLDRLQFLVVRSLGLDDARPLLSVVPLVPASRFQPAPMPPHIPVRLSRFAVLRTNGQGCYVESPLSLHRVLLHRAEAVWLLGALGRPITAAAAAAAVAHPDLPVAHALSYLEASGMVVRAQMTPETGAPVFAEDIDPGLVSWSPIDLMFHSRSTLGRHDCDFGATYPLGERRLPEPVVKPPMAGNGIPLHRPRWEDLLKTDPPLSVAIEGRRSTRDYGQEPLTARELGELLYRTARIRSLIVSPDDDTSPSASDRPYPSGGACYELELYVTVSECTGIPHGAYHYDPLGHRLEPVSDYSDAVLELLEISRMAANLKGIPPVHITMTARIGRVSWKYSGLCYSLILKNVGVLMQEFYLVCAAMGLAACALGSTSIDASARAFGTDWQIETSVGEFLIGRLPDVSAAQSGERHPVNDAQWADAAGPPDDQAVGRALPPRTARS